MICLMVAVAAFAAIFLLGWIWPLVLGIKRTRKGNPSVPLIVVGAVWGFLSISSMALMGAGAFFIYEQSAQYSVKEFDPAECDGPTATITSKHEGESMLNAICGDEMYVFASKDGSFIVPAVEITPQSYSITAKKKGGVDWAASWRFYSNGEKHKFTPEAGGASELKWGPPLTAKIIMKGASAQTQKLDLKVTDSSGQDVRLSSQEAPSFEILDDSGAVVWTYKMRYS